MRGYPKLSAFSFGFLAALSAVAQRGGPTPPPPPPRPLAIIQKSAPIPNRYIVMVDAWANVDPVVDYVRTQLGGTVDYIWKEAVFGFAVQATDQAMQQLAWD